MTEFSAYPYQAFRTYNLLPGDIFFDVGAFRGYVTLKAAQKIGENGFVYAVEPINENIDFYWIVLYFTIPIHFFIVPIFLLYISKQIEKEENQYNNY